MEMLWRAVRGIYALGEIIPNCRSGTGSHGKAVGEAERLGPILDISEVVLQGQLGPGQLFAKVGGMT
jgi:hypothetical protein